METNKIVHILLTEGIFECSCEYNIAEINSILNPMNYVAIEWPAKTCLILKDNGLDKTIKYPWTKETTEEAKKVFTSIAKGERPSSSVIDTLIEKGWIDEEFNISKKALINFEEFFLNLNYQKCEICDILVKDSKMHDFCEKELNMKRTKI